MNDPCTGTTKTGQPCKGRASQWPRGVPGNPRLCGRHLPVPLLEARDAGFAELDRRRRARLAERDPACWAWATRPEGADPHRRLHDWHDGRCAVCGYRASLVTDHDHETGLVRGLLCRNCNAAEPHDDGLFEKYRDRSPASILGVSIRYHDPFNGWAQPDRRRQLDNHPAYALAANLAARLGRDGAEGDS